MVPLDTQDIQNMLHIHSPIQIDNDVERAMKAHSHVLNLLPTLHPSRGRMQLAEAWMLSILSETPANITFDPTHNNCLMYAHSLEAMHHVVDRHSRQEKTTNQMTLDEWRVKAIEHFLIDPRVPKFSKAFLTRLLNHIAFTKMKEIQIGDHFEQRFPVQARTDVENHPLMRIKNLLLRASQFN